MDRDPEGEDWVDALLREPPIAAVEDGGFTRRLAMALPSRPDPLRWIAPVAALIGLITGGALSGGWMLRALGELAARIPAGVLAPAFGDSASVRMLVILGAGGLALTWAAGVWALSEGAPVRERA